MKHGNVTIGIVNHEDKTTNYNLIATLNGVAISNQTYTLENNETKNISFSFTPTETGSNQTLTFDLYKLPSNGTVYRFSIPTHKCSLILNFNNKNKRIQDAYEK